jgi:hypothetical protein
MRRAGTGLDDPLSAVVQLRIIDCIAILKILKKRIDSRRYCGRIATVHVKVPLPDLKLRQHI